MAKKTNKPKQPARKRKPPIAGLLGNRRQFGLRVGGKLIIPPQPPK